jgi:hypothetical protein
MDILKKMLDDLEVEYAMHLMVEHGMPWEHCTGMAAAARRRIEPVVRREPDIIVVIGRLW